MEDTITDFLILIMMFVQFFLALILIYKAVKSKIQSIWLLVFHSFVQAIIFLQLLRTPFLDLGILLSYTAGISYLLAVFFIHNTFYKGQKRVYPLHVLIIILSTINTIVSIYDPYPFFQHPVSPHVFVWANFSLAAIPNYWCAYVILKKYFAFRDKTIQPWIKMRYLIAGISHLSWAHLGIGIMVGVYADILLLFSPIWTATTITIFTIGYFIAWVMPEPLKKFFNRKYEHGEEKEMSEEEIMQLIKEESS
ncbi:MAG: hypothetical protein ACFFBP_06495 [Promethearchaeota archaeon]